MESSRSLRALVVLVVVLLACHGVSAVAVDAGAVLLHTPENGLGEPGSLDDGEEAADTTFYMLGASEGAKSSVEARLSLSERPQSHAALAKTTQDVIWSFCDRCPKALDPRNSGYQALDNSASKLRAGILRPLNYCPPKTKAALATEAIHALATLGYTKTAEYLDSSGLLLDIHQPVTLLAPTNEAYKPGRLSPHVDRLLGSPETKAGMLKNMMLHHMLEGFLLYDEMLSVPSALQKTLLGGAAVLSKGLKKSGGLASLEFMAPDVPNPRTSVAVRGNLFCNALVNVLGVSDMLLPPAEFLPADSPPAPTMAKIMKIGART